jgi:hypothetical protein
LQTTLLGLALALIAAILAAFAAPFFIDWNEWRPELEAQASALAGSRVTISGKIDLTLLPTPAFVLRNVSLGDADNGTGMRASEMRGSLSLTALLSGKIEADEFVVSRPAIRIIIEKDGKFSLPAGASGGQELSVSGFVFEAGSLTIEDRRTNSLFLADDFSARGELLAREGPFRLEGGFRLNGMRWILRASGSRFGPDHVGRVRLVLERPADSIFFEAEGALTLLDAAPRFEGKIIAAQRSGALPWRVVSDVAGNAAEMRFPNLELALGSGDLPITLSGDAKLIPRANGALEVTLASKRIDLDLGDQKAPSMGAAHVLPWLSDARELLRALPFPTQLVISADGILAGGQLMRDTRFELRALHGAVVLERLEARLPGRAAIALTGKNTGNAFSGPLSFESEEPQIFARWLLGEELSGKFALSRALSLKGTLAFTPREVSIGNFQALVENAKLSGKLAFQGWNGRQNAVAADLEGEGMDFDTLLPLARSVLDASGDIQFTLNLLATKSRVLNTSFRRGSLAATRLADGLHIKNFTIDDLDGLNLSAKGAKGEFEYSAEAIRADGAGKALAYLSGSADLANVLTRYAASSYPLRIAGKLTPIKTGWRALGKSGDAEFVLNWSEMRGANRPIEAVLRLPDTEIFAKGELRFGKDGRFEPALSLNLKSSDLGKDFALVRRASSAILPASASAALVRDGNNFIFDKLQFEFAGARGQGRLVFPAGEISPFSGQLSIDRADAGALLSLAIGSAHVSYVELGVALLANLPGTLKVEVGTLAVSERIFLQKASFQIRAGRYETVFEDFQAQLAGGKLTGAFRVADTFPRVLEIKIEAADVALTQLLTAKGLRGALRANLALSANGNSQDALLASVSGQGTLQVTNLELEQTDATSVSTVYTTSAGQPDETKIEQALLAALERAPLKVSKLEAPVVAANGIFRSGSAKAKAGNIEIALSGSLNLPKWSVEALLNIDVAGSASARPGATLRWTGPFEAPERKVDARALIAAITLRAIERGGQNPSGINLPQEERIQPAKKKRAPAKNDVESVPLLPPPANVPPAPQPRSQN